MRPPDAFIALATVLAFPSACGETDGDDTSASESATGSASSTSAASGSAETTGVGSSTSPGSSSGGASGSDTTGECPVPPNPNPEHICCDNAWVDPRSDLLNCGGCGTICEKPTPFCDQGTCGSAPCDTACGLGQDCCGTACCGADEICCTMNGPVASGPGCVAPSEADNCPPGCAPLCQCAAPETSIATPNGERPIAALAVGDLVYSVDDGEIAVVPIARVQRVEVTDHHVVRAILDDGRSVRITASHPLADGRDFGDVRVGDRLGDTPIVEVETIAYDERFTYDILPMSSSATYFVAGELVESTMRPVTDRSR